MPGTSAHDAQPFALLLEESSNMHLRLVSGVALLLSSAAFAAPPADRCSRLLAAFRDRLEDATCFESTDLTTNGPATTPANNSIAGLPPLAFTPVTDRGVISPNPPNRTPITKAVPGVQIQARIAGDPTARAGSCSGCPTTGTGTGGSSSRALRERAVSSTATSPGATTCCRRIRVRLAEQGVLNLQLSTQPIRSVAG